MNIFDKVKQEIKEMVEKAKYIERFDCEVMLMKVKPTKAAMDKRNRMEKRYARLLKKYT